MHGNYCLGDGNYCRHQGNSCRISLILWLESHVVIGGMKSAYTAVITKTRRGLCFVQVINTNVPSLNTQRRLTKSQSGLATSLERLASGLRINSAKDDAAGLAIGDRMTAQIRGQNQAIRNTNDGISLLNVAEGNLGSITDNVQRIRELAVQSANATNSPSDRKALQAEVDQLVAASFAANDQAQFNEIPLFDGTFSAGFQVGANRGDTVHVALPKAMTKPTTVTSLPTTVTIPEHTVTTPDTTTSVPWYLTNPPVISSNVVQAAIGPGDLVINGVPIGPSVAGPLAGQGADSAWAIKNAINAAAVPGIDLVRVDTHVTGDLVYHGNDDITKIPSSETIAAGAIVINGVPIAAISAAAGVTAPNTLYGLYEDFAEKVDALPAINAELFMTSQNPNWLEPSYVNTMGISGVDGANLTVQETVPGSLAKLGFSNTSWFYRGIISVEGDSTPGASIVISGNHPEYAGFTAGTTLATPSSTIGGYTTTTVPGTTTIVPETTVTIPGTTTQVSGDPGSDVLTQENAQKMIDWADQKLQSVDGTRGYIGAMQNRFASIVETLSTSSENLEASRSRIMDADYAQESAALAKNQILQQAGTAMLAQANNAPQNVLSLLPK